MLRYSKFIFTLGIPGIKEIALDYASGEYSQKSLAKKYSLSVYKIRQILDEAVVFCVVSEDAAHQIKKVARINQILHYPDEIYFNASGATRTKSDKRYEELFKKRAIFKEWLLKEINSLNKEIDSLNFQITSYEDFCSSDEWDENPLETLEKDFENLQFELDFLKSFEVD